MPISQKHFGNTWRLDHGAHSETALAPRVNGVKRSLCARMGVRQSELTWIARETLDLYCRSRAKVLAIDQWLESHPMIDEQGQVAGPMKFYVTTLNSSMRALEALRLVVADMAKHDDRFDSALAALERETQ
jgi:hypothetical protein